jgi:hypothetical protein
MPVNIRWLSPCPGAVPEQPCGKIFLWVLSKLRQEVRQLQEKGLVCLRVSWPAFEIALAFARVCAFRVCTH